MSIIYFDNSATSFPKPESVYEEMDFVSRNYGVNAGRGSYRLAHKAGELIEETRELIAKLVNLSDTKNVIITPSATIALNIVLRSISWEAGDNVFYSPFEHNSVSRPLHSLKESHLINLIEIPVCKKGQTYDLIKLEEKFQQVNPKLLVVNHGSNVCGVIAPVEKLAALTHRYGGQVLVDGSQTLGLIPVDLLNSKIDYFAFAGHKNLYGPIGVGGLLINTDIIIKPLIFGGTGSHSEDLKMPLEYPDRLEAGSPTIIAIAGLRAGIKWVEKNKEAIWNKKKLIFNAFLDVLKLFPQITLWGNNNISEYLPVASCSFEGFTPQEMAMVLDQNYDIAVRPGLHCAPLAHKHLGSFPDGTVRFSFGYFNSIDEIKYLQNVLMDMYL